MKALTPLTFQILLALAEAPLHGYGIIKEVASRSNGAIDLEAGTLYAAVKRMRADELIEVAPPPAGDVVDSRRRYYRLTALGRQTASRESERLQTLVELAREKKLLPQESAS